MEVKNITHRIDELITERDVMNKEYNIHVFSMMFNTLSGICDSLQVDLKDISLYHIQKIDDEGYVIHIGIMRDEPTEMVIEVLTQIINDNDRLRAKTMMDILLAQDLQPEPSEGKRILH